MDERHFENEARRKRREEVKNELNQLVKDMSSLVMEEQPCYKGLAGEAIPQVMGCAEDNISPRNVIMALNMTNSQWALANADTLDQTFCLDGSTTTEHARQFLGMVVDTISMYHAVAQGIKPDNLTPVYRQKTMFPQKVLSKLNCTTATVKGYMERISLPRDLDNRSHDTFLRVWFSVIRSPLHVTQDYNCVPFKAALEARLVQKCAAYGRGNGLRWGADDANDAETFLSNWGAFHSNPEDEWDVKQSDPKANMGLAHPEVFANPRSKYFCTIKDRKELTRSIPNDEAKPLVLALREHILRLANNPDSYLQQDATHNEVFRPHQMSAFYKMPAELFTSKEIQLPSQTIGALKTPEGIEKTLPQHVKVCDTHILIHMRAANKKHYENLRELLPLHEQTVTTGNKKEILKLIQMENITPEGYWVLWVPSNIKRANVSAASSAFSSSAQYLFDLVDPRISDRKVTISRYDTKVPTKIGRHPPQAILDTLGAESDAYDSAGPGADEDDDDEMMFDEFEEPEHNDMEQRYHEFLLAVDRFVQGNTGVSPATAHIPMWVWEMGEDGEMKPFSETSDEELATGVCVEIPYFPDWVEAYRAASELPEETDPQIVESTRKAVNRHVTTACQFLKNILSKTRFHTDPVCVTRIAEYYECDKQGRRRTEPDEDENGNLIEDENGELKKRFVVRSRAVRVGVHYIRPLPKNPLYQKSMEIITNYCASTSSPNQKPLPMLYENCPKHRLFHTQWISGTFKDTPESSAKAKCWWEQLRHPAKSNPAYVENLKQYIENGIEGDVKGVSPGPDFTRAQYSTTQGALIENTITFMNNEMGLDYLKSLGKEVWVKKVAKSTNAEWYIKKSIQPWFDDTYKLDDNNRWVVKPSIEYPEICRLDPDHAFEDVFEVMLHTLFDHIGSVYNQYKYCHLVYATFGTAFHKPESHELAASSDSTAASLKFVGDTATGKSHKCGHVLCLYNKDRHVIDEQGNSALCGLGVIWDYRECAMAFSDETNEDKDQEQLRQEKIMQTQGFISRGRSTKKMCPDGVERWVPDYTNNRTNMARVACVNEEAKGGENVKANEDRCLKIYAQESRVAFMKPKSMHGATCRTLKSAIMAQHFQSSRVSEEGKRVLGKMVEHTERLACIETFITTLPSEARSVHMEVAHIRWKDIAAIMSEKGVVWNDRPRLYSTMLKLARFKSVELATLAAFEGQRREDGSKIPFTPENYWEIVPYMYATERTACKVFHYCATESLGVNFNYCIMNSLFHALVNHEHRCNDEQGVRNRFMQSEKYDPRKLVFVFKINKKGGRNYLPPGENCLPARLKKAWGETAQALYGINKTKHDFSKDWERLKKGRNSLADWKIRPQNPDLGDTIGSAEETSEHDVFTFPGLSATARLNLPIIEKVDQNIETYIDDDYLDAISVDMVKGQAPTIEGEPDYSHEDYAVVQISVASFKYTIEQRHDSGKRGDMKDESVIDVVKEFERVDKNLIKKCFMEVCSYKNNMVDPCQRIINKKRKKTCRASARKKYTAEDAKNPLYYRQRVPGMRHVKCMDDGKPLPKKYRVMTIAEPPTYHGGQILNATLASTLVITENPSRAQEFNVDYEEITTTAAALGSEFYKAKKASKERKKKSKPLIWNIDIRAHYERFLKICHETTGLLRGTPWAYKKDWNDKERRSFFCDTYCKRFPPYSVLVHNFPISEDAGHTPQNLLAEYIDASRRSQRKRKCPSNEIADVGEDGGSDTDMNSFFDDDDSDEDDGDDGNEDMDFQAQPGNANSQEGGRETGEEEDDSDDDCDHTDKRQRIEPSMSADSFLASESSIGFDQPIPKQSMTLQDMMDEVSQMDALAEDGVVPLAVQLAQSDEEDERFSNITCHGENRLGSNPFVDQGEGLEQEMSH